MVLHKRAISETFGLSPIQPPISILTFSLEPEDPPPLHLFSDFSATQTFPKLPHRV